MEIFSSIAKNKLRTFLTGFSISWGIFMFCILLSAGNGLQNGIMSNFESRSTNSIQFWGRRTSLPFNGLPERRLVKLDENDINLIKQQIPETMEVSGMLHSNQMTMSYKTMNTSGSLIGVSPSYASINGIKIKNNIGRWLNDADERNLRKVAVINSRMQEVLFAAEDPVGKQIVAGGLGYTVIGVFTEDSWGNDAQAYIPFATAQLLYSSNWGIGNIAFTLKGLETKADNEKFEQSLRRKLALLHTFDPQDERAIGIWNRLENYLQTVGIFNGIRAFIWIIGLGTLIAGIVSVSNIMLITVRERTREFGIRKALGAKPRNILGSILLESAVITSIFGYAGMMLGILVGEVANAILSGLDEGMLSHIVRNPTIDVKVAAGAMLILIVAGVAAGYFPARKAVKIPPVEAMKEE